MANVETDTGVQFHTPDPDGHDPTTLVWRLDQTTENYEVVSPRNFRSHPILRRRTRWRRFYGAG